MLNDNNNKKDKKMKMDNNKKDNNSKSKCKIICRHKFITDDIDLTPERSQRIVYCTKCFITNNE